MAGINPAKAEQLYRELLKSKGFSSEKISKYVERARDLDELADEGFEAAQSLNQDVQKQIEFKKQEDEARADLDARDQAFQETGDYDEYSNTVTTGPNYGPVTSGTVFDAEDDGGQDNQNKSQLYNEPSKHLEGSID